MDYNIKLLLKWKSIWKTKSFNSTHQLKIMTNLTDKPVAFWARMVICAFLNVQISFPMLLLENDIAKLKDTDKLHNDIFTDKVSHCTLYLLLDNKTTSLQRPVFFRCSGFIINKVSLYSRVLFRLVHPLFEKCYRTCLTKLNVVGAGKANNWRSNESETTYELCLVDFTLHQNSKGK